MRPRPPAYDGAMSEAAPTADFTGLSVLVTGVSGTIGRELLRQLVERDAAEVVGIDSNESDLFFLREAWSATKGVNLYLSDVRDRSSLEQRFDGIDVVIHAAALKHVPLCEESPLGAIDTNILGTQNVIDAAIAAGVGRVLLTSSDKAVNPTNVMGTSKLMAERLITAANSQRRGPEPVFASTRFGNVLGSRGSVLPLFAQQIASGGPVTLTDPAMTRFVMTLEEAVSLVLQSVFLAGGGEIFVPKMPVARVEDLARVLIDELAPKVGYDPSDIELRVIGARPGEKMYEELVNDEEVRRTSDLGRFLAIWPALEPKYRPISGDQSSSGVALTQPYHSSVEPAMSAVELRDYLASNGLLEITA